jgi:hypothetical protein
MNPSRRKPRPLTREEKAYRDDRLFIIATEDTYAPERYFSIFSSSRIHVKVLETPRDCGLSAPEHVLERLDQFVSEHDDWMEEDEFWLMLDTDHWIEPNHIQNYTKICTEALGKRYQLAHSNPCFEFWLLLHITDWNQNLHFKRSEEVKKLREDLHRQNTNRTIDPGKYSLGEVEEAIKQAEKLDNNPNDRWPQSNGSHVYKLVKRILGK